MPEEIPTRLAGLLERLNAAGGSVRRSGDEWVARCPAHDDSTPSLSLRLTRDGCRTLMRCRAGCETEAVLERLDLGMADLFHDDEQEELDDEALADEEPGPLDEAPPAVVPGEADPPDEPESGEAALDVRSEV